MENLKSLFNRAHAAVVGCVGQERSAYVQAVEEAKQYRLRGNPNFPHAPDCQMFSGLSVVPILHIWGDGGVDYLTMAKCDDCAVIGEIVG